MIYITGDTHGDWISRLNSSSFPEGRDMDKNDYVIICGDFGLWHDSSAERYNLDWLENKPFTTLFVDGNHENFDRLYAMEVSGWNGGKVHFVRPSVIHLMRGQVFNVCDKKFFTFGGAQSHDISAGVLEPDDPEFHSKIEILNSNPNALYRINHISWWKEELPSQKEMNEGWKNLKKYDNEVDYIITHSPTSSIIASIGQGLYKTDVLSDYLMDISYNINYKQHFFGHMHINENFYAEKSCGLYEQIVRIL